MMLEKLKRFFKIKNSLNPNTKAKNEQILTAVIIAAVFVGGYGLYLINKKHHSHKATISNEEIKFDGSFDEKFSIDSDEALIAKQQKQIDALNAKFNEPNKRSHQNQETKKQIEDLSKKIVKLEEQNIALIQNLQRTTSRNTNHSMSPPTREEMAAKKEAYERTFIREAPIETIDFNLTKPKLDARNPFNYVWAGTFASGIMLTGVMADAGVNGPKNTGTVLIRLDDNGTMPNGKRSRLKDCFVLGSSFGDLSADAVVIHTETLSCAANNLSFEQKVYGSVFDQDAMQDLRGTPVLKTKPLLEYTAAAGLLAGVGDGLANFGSVQAVNPDGSMSSFSPRSMGRTAAGGALSNPANKISDYIMKIADIYHPLVVAKAGRRVSVMFIKGFWIDKEHQKYESNKSIDNDISRNDSRAQIISHVEPSYLKFNKPTLTTSTTDALLLQLASEASEYGIPLVLKGLIDGDFKKTIYKIKSLHEQAKKTNQSFSGFAINPNWFSQFTIETVPALVVTKRSLACQQQKICPNQPYAAVLGNTNIKKSLTLIADSDEEVASIAKSIEVKNHV